MKKEYEDYADNRLKGKFGKLSSFHLVYPILKNKRVLDIGCSDGLYLESFSKDSLGLEQVAELAESAKKRGLDVVNADIIDALGEIKNNSFDAVFYSHVMEHVDSPIFTLKEINRILRPGGTLVLGLPIEKCLVRQLFKHDYFNGTHLYAFSIKNSKKLLLETGYTLESISYHFPWLKGKLGEIVNNIWNAVPMFGKEWISMAYWVIATKSNDTNP